MLTVFLNWLCYCKYPKSLTFFFNRPKIKKVKLTILIIRKTIRGAYFVSNNISSYFNWFVFHAFWIWL